MPISRRTMLLGCGVAGAIATTPRWPDDFMIAGQRPIPTFSVIPVVGDGKWIWTKPPEGQTGYLEPRTFEITTQIKATGRGPATQLIAATVAPSACPEQKRPKEFAKPRFENHGCHCGYQTLTPGATQFVLQANSIADGQVITAKAIDRFEIAKSYFGYQRDQFPAKQNLSRKKYAKYLGTSPGIKVRSASVSKVVKSVTGSQSHPWDIAKAFQTWVFENIKGRPQNYTSVDAAIKNKVGDCEERAGVFIALCRAAGIPARLVWIPSHCWAEILLVDTNSKPHWIPVHTAAYSWFGWTGVHEVVLQKGDNIPIPQQRKRVRLVYDHFQCKGKKPKLEFTMSVRPVADSGKDAGPGARQKMPNGRWKLIRKHAADKFHRKD